MFTPLSLFKGVPCPQGANCTLFACLFSHSQKESETTSQQSGNHHVDDADDTLVREQPPGKRRKIDDEDKAYNHGVSASAQSRSDRSKAGIIELQSASRKVSPPPPRFQPKPSEKKIVTTATALVEKPAPPANAARVPQRRVPKESLNPRMLPKAPATHAVRSAILSKLHAAMSALNTKLAQLKDEKSSSLVLSPDELVVMALDEEEKIARENPKLYTNVIKLRIVKLHKMSPEDWGKEVQAHLDSRYNKPETKSAPVVKEFTSNLTTEQEIALVKLLRTELRGKEQFGYVTKVPTPEEVKSAKKALEAAQGWEKCDRCAGRFQVFPGRRADGALASGGPCTYHPGKIVRSVSRPTDRFTGPSDAYFPCCNQPIGTSAGCTKAKYHVFKTTEPRMLATVLQFEETPSKPDSKPKKPVSFDCEMGYTTLGMELIRLTALSWPEGETLLDVLVRPIGEVLDLNSRYSGIFPEHYARAVPYGTTTTTPNKDYTASAKGVPSVMQIVDSPAVARSLLFQFLTPDTPLIGHAIDNDLNACRIIHPTVIDTALLFPHHRGLPIRHSLKYLAKTHLDRDIQTGGDSGHDSREDALATGDLVRFKVAEKWMALKHQGWTMADNTLVPPPGQAGSLAETGQKRKHDGVGDDNDA
ncbi:hypothetical protein VTN31DRAFT_1538 [Thermomyces dupontii]|uniref:uncharacterized protein n=1 Tax=Talaromyces thermophilus TaxID=28565 RepID=UPI0037449815